MRDGDLNVIADYQYDIYGNKEKATGSFDNPFRYTGQYYDSESGMYYLRARFYDPDLKRFISEDTHWNTGNCIYGNKNYKENEIRYPSVAAMMQSGSLYGYATSNPIRYKDESGKWVVVVSAAASVQCGVAAGAAMGYGIDEHRNIVEVSDSFLGEGLPSASVGIQVAIYFTDSVYNIEGVSFQAGGSGGEGLSIGADAILGGNGVSGFSVSVSAGASVLPGEVHAGIGYTKVNETAGISSIDVLLYLNSVLPDNVKQALNNEVFGMPVFTIGNNTSAYDEYVKALNDIYYTCIMMCS